MKPLVLVTAVMFIAPACSKSEKAEDKPKPAAKAGTAGVLRGTIDIAADRKAAVTPQHTIFVSARPPGAGGGPPLAVLKLAVADFPLAFQMTKENQMVQGGAAFEGDVELTVRIDADGNAMSKQSGDLVWKGPATVGGPDLAIVVTEAIP